MSHAGRILGLALVLLACCTQPGAAQSKLQEVKFVYPAPSSTSWPLWAAKEGGYFAKHGLDAKVEFAMHPAGPAAVVAGEALGHNLGLDTAILAAMKGDQIIIVASPLHIGQFVLLGAKDISDARALAGKRIAVGRIGDPPYYYALGLLNALKVETKGINWIGAGAPPQRALALKNGMADAAMLTPPDYYQLADEGFKVLGNLADHRQIPVVTSYMVRRKAARETPQLVEAMLKAHVEAVNRLYQDKPFAIDLLKRYLKVDEATATRLWVESTTSRIWEKVPYVPAAALHGVVERGKADTPELATFDFRKVIDQSFIDRLADQGFFEQVFGASIKEEVAERRASAFR
ncbi:MAG TPA: ABC transporter substrate-binding protein [Hyphomicrobiaceae bacterium]|jgi:ABC-type nitrate/sulfonate/bicarbonate transport system substrate-binding protein|nr:ABC transporter substrate-binding protein [Hyphomicrobiaceae bacterium]